MRRAPSFDVVVPTIGRPSLARVLQALESASGPRPGRVIVVPGDAGPAAARNAGWRQSQAAWVAFLDDDVVPERDWLARLSDDLAALDDDVGGSQGQIRVPLPSDRKPTDWERNVAALEGARWATADMAYRRRVLAAVGGFDERFRRAYREDADLARRVLAAGYRLERGRRVVTHPVPPADRWVSVRLQRGNADDVLMEKLHPGWRDVPGEPEGRRTRHLVTTAAALHGLAGAATGRTRLAGLGAAAWVAGTAELAWARIAPGPRTKDEVGTMAATSAVLPAAATLFWLLGLVRWRNVRPAPRPEAVLLDRDGTLVVDVPYNGDPERVVPIRGARSAVKRLRTAGVRLAVVSNQSGVARGLLTMEQVEAVNRRVEELFGPLGPWVVCPHAPDDDCSCRKPGPGLVLQAAAALGVDPTRCAVIGDIGSDVEAARAAGARAVLVPTPRTRREEVKAAPEVAPDLPTAVDLLLGGSR